MNKNDMSLKTDDIKYYDKFCADVEETMLLGLRCNSPEGIGIISRIEVIISVNLSRFILFGVKLDELPERFKNENIDKPKNGILYFKKEVLSF